MTTERGMTFKSWHLMRYTETKSSWPLSILNFNTMKKRLWLRPRPITEKMQKWRKFIMLETPVLHGSYNLINCIIGTGFVSLPFVVQTIGLQFGVFWLIVTVLANAHTLVFFGFLFFFKFLYFMNDKNKNS